MIILKGIIANYRARSRLKRYVKNYQDYKIILGAAGTSNDGWFATNYPTLDLCNQNSFARYFRESTVENFLAEHVWEHLTQEEGMIALVNSYFYLKKGGRLRIAVPDGYHSNEKYIQEVKPGGNGPGASDHKILYNYKTLSEKMELAGFKVELLEWFDEFGEFHFREWNIEQGKILRSSRNDVRNSEQPLSYTSLIIDGIK